jgi:hypothetical protein
MTCELRRGHYIGDAAMLVVPYCCKSSIPSRQQRLLTPTIPRSHGWQVSRHRYHVLRLAATGKPSAWSNDDVRHLQDAFL